MLRVGVLASGEGTNLQALLDSVHGREAQIVAVASDKPGARALERAQTAGVPTQVFELDAYPSRDARDAAMAEFLAGRPVDLVVLAGYMALLTPSFLGRFADAVVNVHPSLLPAFAGIRSIQQALDYGVKVFGVTVHYVDEGVDTGPIILQRAIELPDARTVDEVHTALRPLEHDLLPAAVRLVAEGRVRRDPAHPRRILVEDAV
jgi:phosphoribosylglycinamide formyltransferase-1